MSPLHVAATTSGKSADPSEAAFNRRELERFVGDDAELINAILRKFETPTRPIVADINTAFSARDARAIGFAAHKLKSAAQAIGAKILGELCTELEMAAASSDWPIIDARAPTLDAVFDDVISAIREELKKFERGHKD